MMTIESEFEQLGDEAPEVASPSIDTVGSVDSVDSADAVDSDGPVADQVQLGDSDGADDAGATVPEVAEPEVAESEGAEAVAPEAAIDDSADVDDEQSSGDVATLAGSSSDDGSAVVDVPAAGVDESEPLAAAGQLVDADRPEAVEPEAVESGPLESGPLESGPAESDASEPDPADSAPVEPGAEVEPGADVSAPDVVEATLTEPPASVTSEAAPDEPSADQALSAEDPVPEDPLLEHPVPEDPVPEQPAPEQPAPEQPVAPVLDHQPVIGESAPSLPAGEHGAPKRPAGPAVAVGRLVEVTIAAVRDNEVEVKLADGRLGVIPRADVEGADGRVGGVGDSITAALLAREDPKRRVVLSRSWAAKQQAWDRLEAAHTEHTVITGSVQKVVKGGLLVAVGVPAFLPASLVDEHTVEDLSTFVGQELEVLVSELDKSGGKVVLNRRDVLRRRRREAERELYSRIAPGQRATGTVISTADYGALIDVNGVRGLLHRTEMSWGWIASPADAYKPGQQVEVLVTEVNRSKRRVSLSVRQLLMDPFSEVQPGQVIEATISRVVEYGAFALIDGTDVEGLVHISEIADVPGYRPEHLVAPGERVMAKVLNVDKKRRRIGLSIRQAVMIDGLE